MRILTTYSKRGLNTLFDTYWDSKLGINTRGISPSAASTQFDDNVECNPTGYRLLRKVLNRLPLDRVESEVLVDYGCGKGRAVCVFAQMPFKKVIGVEVSPVWAAHSRENVDRLRGRKAKQIEIVIEDAVNFDPCEGTIFYFFNPFGERTFKNVLDRIYDSVQRNPRDISIVYFNAVCQETLDGESWLQQQQVIHTDTSGNPAILLYRNTR